ncbi:MAG TPA: hydrolase [Gammaproteobacteria bacterium]|jgi:predicted alpha/beta-fold hydrolase|nr:hydrolase [Gammaproteobacteria bacterium]
MDVNDFKPAWWLKNPHLQTLWPMIRRNRLKGIPVERERIELPDGDFIDIDWVGKKRTAPIVLILHGFEGSIASHYAKSMMRRIYEKGWRGAFVYFRGCSGEPNRLPRSYHSGETKDIAYITSLLCSREPRVPIGAIGYSLGGNVLLKWLGETAQNNPLTVAIAVSVPFQIHDAAYKVQKGFSRLYQWYLLKSVRQRLQQKFTTMAAPVDIAGLVHVDSIVKFDSLYTVPLHGFADLNDYYESASSRQYLHNIHIPTLIIHAKDDPFMTPAVIPSSDEVSPSVKLELSESGGHVGFVSGKYPWRPTYWLDQRIPTFLSQHL